MAGEDANHYTMGTAPSTAINLMSPNCCFSSIDWKDAYFSVPIAKQFQIYLRFRCGGRGQTLSIYILHPEITKIIKAPPIAPLIPYFPKLFGMESFFPPFYFTYFIVALAIVAVVHELSHRAKRFET